MTKKDLILIGGGGHCKACIDVIESDGRFNIAGIVDSENKIGTKVFGYKVIASDKGLPNLIKKYKYFVITIGSIKDPYKRIERFEYLKQLEGEFPMIISPLAYISKSAHIGGGTIVMHKAILNADASVGENCIINTAALIEHDSTIGDHCHISTGSIINGKCKIGKRVFIGSNSVVADNVDIMDDVIIGAGSVVVKSISQPGTYVGSPVYRVNK